jgi:hypothetical protein
MQSSQSLIDRLYAADSIIALLGQLNVSKFPWEERIAVGVCQAEAQKAWWEACRDAKPRLRSRRSHQAAVHAARPLRIP